MSRSSATLSAIEDESGGQPVFRPALVFVFGCEDLTVPSTRIELDPHRTVEVGRGRGEAPSLADDRIEIPDPRMSSRHARFLPLPGGLAIEDLSSKNGTRVGDEPVSRATPLKDGDILELGHSFFVYRHDEPWQPVVREAPPESGPRLATLLAPLAARYRALQRVAPGEVPVMARGESGVGKELVAGAVHAWSERRGPFVPVNCGALPDTLVEAELFGSSRGAFSGADRDRPGFVRSADRGTLFLDEIGELSAAAQAKLLRVLQERAVTPLGESRPIPVDFRLVTATHRDLRAAVGAGTFRADLLARISGFEMSIPPLRERREDLGALLRRFLRDGGRDLRALRLTRNLGRRLMTHPWPHNIRELEKGVALALSLADDGVLDRDAFPLQPAEPAPSAALQLSPEDEARRRELMELLERHEGNITHVAQSMGKARMQIHRWMKRYGIDPRSARADSSRSS